MAGCTAAGAWPSLARARCDTKEADPTLQPQTTGRVLRVSTGDPLLSLAATARAARDGDTIEVDPGDYRGDVAVWPQNDLLIRAVSDRPRLIADGRSAEDKAIFVIKGQRVRVEGLEFRGVRVRDRNGAGIRQERGPLTVHDCVFADNENGILSGNIPTMELAISNSTFLNNGNDAGSAHNVYAGAMASLHVEGCWFGRSRVGHLLKSRARVNVVRYSRLTGEDGSGSYELEFAEGGEAIVLGNLIQQGPSSQNQTIVSYGVEGYRWPDNTLTMAFNTIVNDRAKGSTFVRVSKGATHATLFHNLLVGRGSLAIDAPLTSMGNVEAARKEFANPDALDYRLRTASILVGRAGFRGAGDSSVRLPMREYTHEASCCALEGMTSLTPLSPGAFQRLAR
jgi:hypothetical protein